MFFFRRFVGKKFPKPKTNEYSRARRQKREPPNHVQIDSVYVLDTVKQLRLFIMEYISIKIVILSYQFRLYSWDVRYVVRRFYSYAWRSLELIYKIIIIKVVLVYRFFFFMNWVAATRDDEQTRQNTERQRFCHLFGNLKQMWTWFVFFCDSYLNSCSFGWKVFFHTTFFFSSQSESHFYFYRSVGVLEMFPLRSLRKTLFHVLTHWKI